MFIQTHTSIQLLQVLHIYSAAADTFLQVPDMPAEIPEQICAALTELQAVEKGFFSYHFAVHHLLSRTSKGHDPTQYNLQTV